MNESLQLIVLVLCLIICSATNRKHTGHDLHLIGRATVASKLSFKTSIKRLSITKPRLRRKNYFSCLRCKVLPILRCSGLYDDWITLRRTGHIERSAHFEMVALMVEHMQFIQIDVYACFLLVEKGIIIPTIPQPGHNLYKLASALIAQCMVHM